MMMMMRVSSVSFVTNATTNNSKKRLRRRNRGLASFVAAAGEKNDSISTSSEEELFDFFSILSSSIETKIRKDFNELIREPILSGKPEELRDTIPVEKLADQDSKFLEVYLENESDAEKRRMEEKYEV